MQEKLIEKDGVKYAEDRGWLVYKWAAPGRAGVHDRLFFQRGIVFTIEYKASGERATPKQRAEAVKLKCAGVPARCCDSVQSSRAFIDYMTDLLKSDPDDISLNLTMLSCDISSFDP